MGRLFDLEPLAADICRDEHNVARCTVEQSKAAESVIHYTTGAGDCDRQGLPVKQNSGIGAVCEPEAQQQEKHPFHTNVIYSEPRETVHRVASAPIAEMFCQSTIRLWPVRR